jgi:predicted metal-binding membrane protein
MLAMWVVMMAGMMLPSASPTIRLYQALQSGTAAEARRSVALFAFGYLFAWSLFSVAATALQWALSEGALLSPTMKSATPALSAAAFIAAGLYQFSAAKRACLAQCRSPAQFLVRHRREGLLGAFRVGARHGVYCIGCCWALMALLFVFGVMNLLWVAAIAALVLAEKVLPARARIPAWGGAAMVGVGILLLN